MKWEQSHENQINGSGWELSHYEVFKEKNSYQGLANVTINKLGKIEV